MVSVQFCKKFAEPLFYGRWSKKLQTFSRHLFWERPSKYCIVKFTTIFVCLLLSSSRRYSMNEVATLTARSFNIVDHYTSILRHDKPLPKYLIQWKFKMSAIFILKKGVPRKLKLSYFFTGRFFVMDDPIDINEAVFSETSVSFLQSVVLELYP